MKSIKLITVIISLSILLLIIPSCSLKEESWLAEKEILNDKINSQTNDIVSLNNIISKLEDEAVINETLLSECYAENQNETIESTKIPASDNPIGSGEWTIIEAYNYDFNKDGNDDLVQMLTSAVVDDNNIIMWDDGQYFVLTVTIGDKIYTLINEYIQIGRAYFSIFDDSEPGIIVTVSSFAGLKMSKCTYNSEEELFEAIILLETGDLNIIHNSMPWD